MNYGALKQKYNRSRRHQASKSVIFNFTVFQDILKSKNQEKKNRAYQKQIHKDESEYSFWAIHVQCKTEHSSVISCFTNLFFVRLFLSGQKCISKDQMIEYAQSNVFLQNLDQFEKNFKKPINLLFCRKSKRISTSNYQIDLSDCF